MTVGVALVIFAAFWLISCIWLAWRVDLYFALVYAMLFIYTIFAQYGYYFRSDISMHIRAYFGPEVFWEYYWLVFLSFIFLFVLMVCFGPLFLKRRYYAVAKVPISRARTVFLFYSVVHWLFLVLMLYEKGDEMSYATASSDDFALDRVLMVTGMAFKAMMPCLLIWWFILREGLWRRFFWLGFGLGGAIFSLYCVKLGNRTDILALFLGIAVYELSKARLARRMFREVLVLGIGALFVLAGAAFVEKLRSGQQEAAPLEDRILLNDYFAPSHMLFAAISYDYVQPREVLKSNINNSLILRAYPYLQATITDLFQPGLATRSQGYAFYIFTEGYLVLGRLGFIYNGLIVFLGLLLWRVMALSRSSSYNLFVLMLIGSMAANCVRGQSCYFLKCGYMYFIPALVLFYLATGLSPIFLRKRYGARIPPG